MEYVANRGSFAELPLEEILSAFEDEYGSRDVMGRTGRVDDGEHRAGEVAGDGNRPQPTSHGRGSPHRVTVTPNTPGVSMGSLRPWHIAVLVVVLVLLFGAKRLPDAARSLGRAASALPRGAPALRP